MMRGRDFIMNGPDPHNDRSKCYHEQSRFSWWQVEIILWMVEIFIITSVIGCDFRLNSKAGEEHFTVQIWWATAKHCCQMSLPYPSSDWCITCLFLVMCRALRPWHWEGGFAGMMLWTLVANYSSHFNSGCVKRWPPTAEIQFRLQEEGIFPITLVDILLPMWWQKSVTEKSVFGGCV